MTYFEQMIQRKNSDKIWNQIHDKIRDQVWDQVCSLNYTQVRDRICNQVWDQVCTQIRDKQNFQSSLRRTQLY
jgi:hypothetical protein